MSWRNKYQYWRQRQLRNYLFNTLSFNAVGYIRADYFRVLTGMSELTYGYFTHQLAERYKSETGCEAY